MNLTERLRNGVLEQLDNLLFLSDEETRFQIANGENYDVDWDHLLEEYDSAIYAAILGASCYLSGVCDALDCSQKQLYKLLVIDLKEQIRKR